MLAELDAFRNAYLVSGLDKASIELIASISQVRALSHGAKLVTHGEESADLYVLLEGSLNVRLPDGDKLAEIGPGNVIGEIALIDARPRTADVSAVGPVKVAAIPAKDFRKMLNQNRDMGFLVICNLSRVLCMRLREANEKVDSLMDRAKDPWEHAL